MVIPPTNDLLFYCSDEPAPTKKRKPLYPTDYLDYDEDQTNHLLKHGYVYISHLKKSVCI